MIDAAYLYVNYSDGINWYQLISVDKYNSTMFKALTRLHNYGFSVRTYHNFYNGEFVPSKGTRFYDVYNPVTQELIARSPQSTEEEFNAIVANAKEAFTTWSRVPILSIDFVI